MKLDLWSVFRETGEPMSYVFLAAARAHDKAGETARQTGGKDGVPDGDGKKSSGK